MVIHTTTFRYRRGVCNGRNHWGGIGARNPHYKVQVASGWSSMIDTVGEATDMVIHTTTFRYRPRGLQWLKP